MTEPCVLCKYKRGGVGGGGGGHEWGEIEKMKEEMGEGRGERGEMQNGIQGEVWGMS